MPRLNDKSGDIFNSITEGQYELAIVFGHTGYCGISASLDDFRRMNSLMEGICDPFIEFAEKPFKFETKGKIKWLWLINAHRWEGMGDDDLTSCLGKSLSWAASIGVINVITNGINSNRCSDDKRTDFLFKLLKDYEMKFNLNVTLISQNNVFTRRLNDPQFFNS